MIGICVFFFGVISTRIRQLTSFFFIPYVFSFAREQYNIYFTTVIVSFLFKGKQEKLGWHFIIIAFIISYREILIFYWPQYWVYIYIYRVALIITYYSFLEGEYPLFFFPLALSRICLFLSVFFFFYSLSLLLLLLLSRNNNNNNNNKRLDKFLPFCRILLLILPPIYKGCIHINNSHNMQCIRKKYATHGCSP